MLKCCNYGCSNTPFNNKIRCGICRRSKVFLCMDCGTEHNQERALRCKTCRDINLKKIHDDSSKKWRDSKRVEKFCKNCGTKLPTYRSSYCRNECQKEATITRLMKRRKITNCKVCNKSLMGTRKHGYCSDECWKSDRETYMEKFNEKRRKPSYENCMFCNHILTGNQRFNCGKEECMRKYNTKFQREKRISLRG